ncbi:hypothetical protein [Secundilactobacillus kimchicus]|uniref:Uncharacterized protein n=1 Tax=Secundilactobacillus kimchicus JCM 15530 TaxID=1302272 RepID=A0A0R1HV54_9LACO|nr:hypothetical protein [Secundilactobacillus kimchicus]KRK47194.1 hypothetical protein FC96_GL000654 [Secundilactobacillus kimchicus JCM 15530]MBT9671685.1 hypothetical protein [Secundilactobacillus kimchicus]
MGKKLGLLVGLVAGAAAAHIAYHRLDETQKAQLRHEVEDKVAVAKDRAVDYVFYASDAWDDFKTVFADQSQEISARIKDVAASWNDPQAAEDELREELSNVATEASDGSDDIVLSSEQTFGGADIAASIDPTQTVVIYPNGTVKPAN